MISFSISGTPCGRYTLDCVLRVPIFLFFIVSHIYHMSSQGRRRTCVFTALLCSSRPVVMLVLEFGAIMKNVTFQTFLRRQVSNTFNQIAQRIPLFSSSIGDEFQERRRKYRDRQKQTRVLYTPVGVKESKRRPRCGEAVLAAFEKSSSAFVFSGTGHCAKSISVTRWSLSWYQQVPPSPRRRAAAIPVKTLFRGQCLDSTGRVNARNYNLE